MMLSEYNEILRRKIKRLLGQRKSWGSYQLERELNRIIAESVEEYYDKEMK